MGELPTGTVTFMFTDIEGSTRLLHRLGPDYEQALRGHRRILRDAFSSCGGVEVDTQGDAFVAFATVADAVEAVARPQRALAQHRWPQQEELRVRMGIHTGEPTVTDEGYVGDDVHKGAGICGAAHGGQVLVSESTTRLLPERLEGIRLRDLGEHSLKDLTGRVRLYQLIIEDLRADFPPIRTLDAHPTTFPPAVTADREHRESPLRRKSCLCCNGSTTNRSGTRSMSDAPSISFTIKGRPPSKAGSGSPLGATSKHRNRVVALLEAAGEEMRRIGFEGFGNARVRLEVEVRTGSGEPPWDATNLLGGIADVLDSKAHKQIAQPGMLDHLSELVHIALYDDDRQIQEVSYRVVDHPDEEYVVTITAVG